MLDTPQARIRCLGNNDIRSEGHYVLYWMTSARRGTWNFGLQRAVHWATTLRHPLLILEALRCGYRWSSDRLHAFLLQGMRDNASHFARKRLTYFPYVEPVDGAGQGLLAALAADASVVVSDDFPCFFLPRMYEAAERQIPVRFELVDSNGLLPMRATTKVFARAFDFRRHLQQQLPQHLDAFPEQDPVAGAKLAPPPTILDSVLAKWPAADLELFRAAPSRFLQALPIDHQVNPAPWEGGTRAAQARLRGFLEHRLAEYATARNEPERDVTSGLSPYLHAGHLAAHQVFAEITARAGWSLGNVGEKADGSSQGWWGTSESVESFLDEMLTWRELGFNMCAHRSDYDQYDSLPQWSRETLRHHARDPRDYVYSLEEFERAATHDALWNAAQTQLVREGRIHNYLRMLWGKKVLEWSASPQEALQVLIQLNNKYALDGRDPNSYSGIFWCLGRYDRAWGPERPVYGKIRYMSSENTARKVRVKDYLRQYQTPGM